MTRWLIDHARNYEHIQILNKTDQVSAISINGPKSRALLQKLTSTDVSDKAFGFMQNKELNIGGVSVLALRVSYTGKFLQYSSFFRENFFENKPLLNVKNYCHLLICLYQRGAGLGVLRRKLPGSGFIRKTACSRARTNCWPCWCVCNQFYEN